VNSEDEFFKGAAERLAPALRQSAIFLGITPAQADPDPKFAMELGMSILMGKPILIVTSRDAAPPEALVRAADEVLVLDDFHHPERDQARLQDAISRLLAEKGLTRP